VLTKITGTQGIMSKFNWEEIHKGNYKFRIYLKMENLGKPIELPSKFPWVLRSTLFTDHHDSFPVLGTFAVYSIDSGCD